MRSTTVRPSIRNMFFTILGLFISFIVIPSSSFADPFWSIGISGGNGGINGFTLSMGDYGGIPVYVEQSRPPCRPPYGHAYGYYNDHPRQHWGRGNYHHEGYPQHMSRPNGYPRNGYRQDQHNQGMSRPNQHNQTYNRPDAYQQNGSLQNQQRQTMSKPNQYAQNINRPNGYQQNNSRQNQQSQNISKPNREKQHQWEMRMMNTSMTSSH